MSAEGRGSLKKTPRALCSCGHPVLDHMESGKCVHCTCIQKEHMTYQQAVMALIASGTARMDQLDDGDTSLAYPGEDITLQEAIRVAGSYNP